MHATTTAIESAILRSISLDTQLCDHKLNHKVYIPLLMRYYHNYSMESSKSFSRILGYWCIGTGIFALIGSLYTWGEGILFTIASPHIPVMVTDLILMVPFSFILGIAILNMKNWAKQLSLFYAGMTIYSSFLVYSTLFVIGPPYDTILMLIPIFGILQSLVLIYWSLSTKLNLGFEVSKSRLPDSYIA